MNLKSLQPGFDYVAHREFGEYANLNFPNEIPTEEFNPETMNIRRRPRIK